MFYVLLATCKFHPLLERFNAFYKLAKGTVVACRHVGVWQKFTVRKFNRILCHLGEEKSAYAAHPVFFFLLAVAVDVCRFNPAFPIADIFIGNVACQLYDGIAQQFKERRACDGSLFKNCKQVV